MASTAELLKTKESSHTEGAVAKTIEKQTAKIPSDVYLWSAMGAIGCAASLQLMGRKQGALFVGQWVAPLLLLGVYNKIVKVAGSDRMDRRESEPTERIAGYPA